MPTIDTGSAAKRILDLLGIPTTQAKLLKALLTPIVSNPIDVDGDGIPEEIGAPIFDIDSHDGYTRFPDGANDGLGNVGDDRWYRTAPNPPYDNVWEDPADAETQKKLNDWRNKAKDYNNRWFEFTEKYKPKPDPAKVKTPFEDSKKFRPPRDPILLDLDGNGIKTVGLAANIHFDYDNDGVLTQTGWVGNGDALLVLDRNSNGNIDNGAELFGDYTPITRTNADGSTTTTYAPNGFAALASLDSNNDGIIDANDAAFADLKLWRDTNQDGTTNSGELITLAQAGIVSLNLANVLKNQATGNGNTLTREGSFTKLVTTLDSATGQTVTQTVTQTMGEYNLAINTFDTQFKDNITISDTVKTLPNMQGSGNVRELQQAATQSSSLQSLLSQFSTATTRTAQKALLDQIMLAWADNSGMAKSLTEQAAGKFNIQYDAFGAERRSNNIKPSVFLGTTNASSGGTVSGSSVTLPFDNSYLTDKYQALITEWTNKLHILEAFNGQYFFNLPSTKSQTAGANIGLSVAANDNDWRVMAWK